MQHRALTTGGLLALLVLALGVPFLAYLAITFSRQATEDRDKVGQQMLAVARVTAARLDDHVGDIHQVLTVLSAVVGTTVADAPRNDALFKTLQRRLPPRVSNLSVWALDGHNVGSLEPSGHVRELDVSNRRFFLDALGSSGLAVEAPYPSVENGEEIAIFSIRVEREGRVQGVVAVSAQLREMELLLAPKGSVPDGSVITVSSDTGIVLARSMDPEKWIGKSLLNADRELVRSLSLGSGVRDGPSADGVDRIAGFTTAVRVPWLVYVGLPVETAIAPSRVRLQRSVAIGVGLLLVGLMLSTWLAQRISRPLQQLEQHARRIGRGELDSRAPQRGVAEIESLASTLDGMAIALKSHTAQIEASEEALADLYENAPCGYYSLDATGHFTRVNDTELRWLGRSRDEVIGKHINEFLGADGRAAFAQNFPILLAHGHVQDVEFDLPSKSGGFRRVALSATALTDSQGHFVETRTVTYDITELKRVRDELERLTLEQNAMLETDLIGIVKVKNRRITWSNAGANLLLGYEGKALTGKDARVLYISEEQHAQIGNEAYAELKEARSYRVRLELRKRDGQRRWFKMLAMALPDDETMAMLVDITALTEAEDSKLRALAIESENHQLVESNRVKSLFLANMSHELRTPLNGILGYAHLLRGGIAKLESTKVAAYSEKIDRSGRQLLNLIDAMLDFAKAESDKLEFRPRSIDVRTWLDHLLRAFAVEIEAKRINMSVEIDGDLSAIVADELRLTQIAAIFVSNAIKFSSDGSPVQLRLRKEGSKLFSFEATDSGIGIEEKDLPRLFVPFQQLSEGRSKAYEGVGLGLALARRLVEAQGGSVGVQSCIGVGSTFVFRLPIVC